VVLVGYFQYCSERIIPGVRLGNVSLGGLQQEAAASKLGGVLSQLQAQGVEVVVQDTRHRIDLDSGGFNVDIAQAIDVAFSPGHTGSIVRQLWERLSGIWRVRAFPATVEIDETVMRRQIDDIALRVNSDARDIRLAIAGTTVSLLTDTQSGVALDRESAYRTLLQSLRRLSSEAIVWSLIDQNPRASLERAPQAVAAARRMIAFPMQFVYEDASFVVSRTLIASWIISTYTDTDLVASMSGEKIAEHVTKIATSLNVAPVPPQISTADGRVTGFVPAKVGRAVQETVLIDMIARELDARAHGKQAAGVFTVPVKSTTMALTGLDDASGIKEVVGKATTPFTGSPRNRISNIKNGVRFISGATVEPGAEFSTLATLGIIDNTTGYLPELVIKGDRTIPEFGGGLCQVSTTLFRAVMDAGLPVTRRRNHSFRVSYYEKDGTGKVIGPGLDATIYEPDVDFRFRNTTAHPILIIGYVVGDKISFELYGTRDGRTSQVIGPIKLTETPAGDPIYTDDPELPKGTTKQLETPHPGGSAIATYIINMPDGTKEVQEFKSWYRPWPARFAVGTKE
jgi:vancomycin resistance protein YoaR